MEGNSSLSAGQLQPSADSGLDLERGGRRDGRARHHGLRHRLQPRQEGRPHRGEQGPRRRGHNSASSGILVSIFILPPLLISLRRHLHSVDSESLSGRAELDGGITRLQFVIQSSFICM